ncbi:MAG: fibronectin type III domain-containing protein [Anaerolineae bacterium]
MKLGLVGGVLGCILFAVACGNSPATGTPAPSQPATISAVTTVVGAATATPIPAPAVSAAGLQIHAEARDTAITLTWTPVSGTGGYFVYRDGSPTPLNTQPITGTTFQDIGLTNGRTYTYTVAPAGPDGKAGAPSAPVQAAPQSH